MFCAWERGRLTPDLVSSWAWRRLQRRYEHGTMRLETSDSDVFVGLHTRWSAGSLDVRPTFPDPWGAWVYSDADNTPLKPWTSWAPQSQKFAVLRALLCRCAYLSNNSGSRHAAFCDALVMVVCSAFFLFILVAQRARRWAATWAPRRVLACGPRLLSSEVDVAIQHVARTFGANVIGKKVIPSRFIIWI